MNVFPQQFFFDPTRGELGQYLSGADVGMSEGLTKRELFAAMALQGMLAHPRWHDETVEAVADEWREAMAMDAVLQSDALIAALSEQQP